MFVPYKFLLISDLCVVFKNIEKKENFLNELF